jgi:hypothetical protein
MANQYSSEMPAFPDEILERRIFVMKHRNRGYTWEEVTDAWEKHSGRRLSINQLYADFRIIMKQRSIELREETDEIRTGQVEVLRMARKKLLDHLIDRDGPPNLEAVEVLIKLEARIARLLGTDAATKSEVSVTRKPELTTDQIREKMQEIQARIRERLGEPGTVVEGQVVPQRAELPEPRQVTPQIIAGTADDEPVLGEPHT